MIEVSHLVKRYGKNYALDDVSFTVEKGEIVGFLGPNGAGKSTTMNILTGYISSTSGSACVDGFDILKQPNEVKKRIGYLPENPPLYLDMMVDEYLNFVYELKKVKMEDRQAHLDQIMDIVKIKDVSKRRIGNLSKGYKQRVGLAQALIGNPEVLILDEPTVGLDPVQIIEIRNLIKELGKERTIILSSHILPEVAAVCERVLIINQGRLIASDTTEHLLSQYTDQTRLVLTVEADDEITPILLDIPGVLEAVLDKGNDDGTQEYSITIETPEVRRELLKQLAQNDIPVQTLQNTELTLEDIFLQLTQQPLDESHSDEDGLEEEGGFDEDDWDSASSHTAEAELEEAEDDGQSETVLSSDFSAPDDDSAEGEQTEEGENEQ